MKFFYCFIIGLFFLFFSCESSYSHEEIEENKDEVDTLENDYAVYFRVIDHHKYYELQIINPDKSEVEFTYTIGKGDVDNNVMIKAYPNRVVALSSTHIGMMNQLGLQDHIVGVSNADYLCDDYLKKKAENGALKSLGEVGVGDIETFLSIQPDLILYSGFNMDSPIFKKLKTAEMILLVNYEWKETHPLGRAEWIKVFGLLFGKSKEANTIFNTISNEYIKLKDKVKSMDKRPTVLAGTFYGDVFNAPAGDSYMAHLLRDINVDYVYGNTNGTGSLSLSLEEVITKNRNIDYLINIDANSLKDVLKLSNRFKLLKAFENKNIYSYSQEMNCFWERSAIQPHILFQDLYMIFHKDSLNTDGSFDFYNRLH